MLRDDPFGSNKFLASSKVTVDEKSLCEICQYAKSRCKAVHGKDTTVDKNSKDDPKNNHLRPGAAVSTGHFE